MSDDPQGLPRQRRGITPQMHGRYPDFDVLAQAPHWDAVTRRVVLARLQPPELRFFTEDQAQTLTAFCDMVLAQDREPRIPVLAFVDDKLASGRLDGFRYADMPPDPDTWRLVAAGLDEAAVARGASSYADAGPDARTAICEDFARGRLSGGTWDRIPASRAFAVVMRAVLAAFYAHPWAWNEIGFGGPAYPRGYARRGIGEREPWEREDAFPLDAVRDVRERGLDHGGDGEA